MHPATLLSLAAATAQAYELCFYLGGGCTGENLAQSSDTATTGCNSIDTHPESQAQSFITSSNDPTDSSNDVNAFTEPD